MWKSIFLLVNYTFQSLEYLTLIAQLQLSVVRYFSVTLYVTLDTNNWFPTSPWQLHVSFFWYDSLIKTQTNSSCLFIYLFISRSHVIFVIIYSQKHLGWYRIHWYILAKPEKWQGQICAGIMNRRSSFSSSIGVLCFSLSVCLSHFSTTAWSAMRRHRTSVQLTVYERFVLSRYGETAVYVRFYHWCTSRFCLYEDALCIIHYIYIFVNITG